MAIPREARRITYSTNIRALKLKKFTDKQRALVIGSILGDGCLHPNWSTTNYRLKIDHSVKQKKYVLWKYGILKNFVLTKPKIYKPTQSISFKTISHPELSDLKKKFYDRKKKIIPNNIRAFLKNPMTIAIWFMDDGNALKDRNEIRGYHLNTQSFSFSENQIIVDALKYNWDLHCSIQKNKGHYRIYIGADSKDRFYKIVHQYIIPSIQYKLG